MILEGFTPDHQAIIDLVKDKRLVTIYYKGDKETAAGWRTIEPLCYGEKRGRRYLRAWQRKGKTTTFQPEYKFFRIDRISNWNLNSNQNFTAPPDIRFNPSGDKLMKNIYAIAQFGKDNGPDEEPDDDNDSGGGGTPDTTPAPGQPGHNTIRHPKRVNRVKNGKPVLRVRNNKPVIRLREELQKRINLILR